MKPLSISAAWEEGSRFAMREFRLLFPIAFLLTAVPGMLVGLLVPAEESMEMAQLAQFVQRNGVASVVLIAMAVALILFVIQTFAGLAISYLTLRPGASVGESFSVAARRLPAVMGALLLLGLAMAAVAVPLVLVLPSGPANDPSGAMLLVSALLLLAILAVSARFLPLAPAGVAEPLGPIRLIARAWSLTRDHFWRLVGTMLLIGLVYTVAFAVIGIVTGLLVWATVGDPLTNRSAMFAYDLILAVPGSVVTIFLLCFFARIYAHLSGRVQEVGKVFE